MNNKVGIYFYYSDKGRCCSVEIDDVISYTKNFNGNIRIWKTSDLQLNNVAETARVLASSGIERLVIAGENTGEVKSYFTYAMATAGKNPENIILADFWEYGATGKSDTGMVKEIVRNAVEGMLFDPEMLDEEDLKCSDTLVIGAGIAGIQASLEIADSNQKVYLIEKTGTIGGHMAMFDKTFPTLDCAACILTPKMVEVGQHESIELMTYSEVIDVSGSPGNFTVRILKKTRRVDIAACIGCGICAEKCPSSVPSEFDNFTTLRKAIYIPFPQAVPNKYLVDKDSCTYFKTGKCRVCEKVCPAGCVHLDDKDQEVEIKVGNIIVATGFQIFDAKRAEQFGYGKYPNVLTSLEFERLVNASGPTGGNITGRSQDKKGRWIFTPDGEVPKSISLIHCIGSRDENYNKYCSKVCCMYSLKLAHLVKEKLPDAEVTEYFIDMRAFGKGYEEFYERIKHEGVHMVRGRTAKVEQNGNSLVVRSEDIINGNLLEKNTDMVILAVGLEPRENAAALAKMLGIRQGEDGWYVESNQNYNPVETFSGGIHIAGLCQGPKDIPDTVAQASAAASRVLQSIMKKKIQKNIYKYSFK